MKVRLSAVIIAYNEEKKIETCLQSIYDIVDEIIVVDSYSTDKTAEICARYSVRFIQNAFVGHIQQKNYAISQASHTYVLSLDADEALDEEARQAVLDVKNNWEYDGYYLNRLNQFCGKWIKHSGWYPDRKLRLWDSQKGSWQGTNPHDKFVMQDGAKTSRLAGNILHYTIEDLHAHMAQINVFTDISAKALFDKGKKASIAKILISPIVKFIRDYFVKAGFLDGFAGLLIAKNSAHAKFLKYCKLYMLHQRNKK